MKSLIRSPRYNTLAWPLEKSTFDSRSPLARAFSQSEEFRALAILPYHGQFGTVHHLAEQWRFPQLRWPWIAFPKSNNTSKRILQRLLSAPDSQTIG
ncbi:hypothetical protein RRG08_036491 [Elysia crispata]|uniref:Uncharacterized protein n=1 Tax=Elysia crispata TaxID=231223 RepID=A0AAE0ZLX5_9GAST|nr:hypothetical protein RRG08_036491 [Elysia crispata]